MRMLIATVLAAVLAVAAFAQTGRKVVGTVYAGASPLAGAQVQYDEDNLRQTTTTDSKGGFELPGPANRGVVTVRASRYGTRRLAWPPYYRGRTLEVFLKEPSRVQGTVADAVS